MRTKSVRAVLLLGLVILPPVLYWRARSFLSQYEGLHPGDAMPTAKLQTLDGRIIETSSWLGSPTLLMVMNPECRSCQEEIRSLASVAHLLPGLKIALLSARTDLGSLEAPFPVYLDRSGGFLTRVQRLATPAVYWIDAAGKVRYARMGQRDAADEHGLFRKLQAEEP